MNYSISIIQVDPTNEQILYSKSNHHLQYAIQEVQNLKTKAHKSTKISNTQPNLHNNLYNGLNLYVAKEQNHNYGKPLTEDMRSQIKV